jgi:transposase
LEKSIIEDRQKKLSDRAKEVCLSVTTTRKTLHEMGYRGCVAKKKPFLSDVNVAKRFHWGKMMYLFQVSFWSNVIFSDESNFDIVGNRRAFVWRKPDEKFDSSCLRGTVKFGGGSVSVWGAIWRGGKTDLVFYEGRLNAERYIELLERHLLPLFVQGILLKNTHVFQEDGAPCHTAKKAQAWGENHGIRVLPWPAQSPDMNPIEHVWDHMDRILRKIDPKPKNCEQVKLALTEIWGRLDEGEKFLPKV